MTTSQFLAVRIALISASLLAEQALARSVKVRQTPYYRHIAQKVEAGLRPLDSLENERADQPPPKQQLELAETEVVS